MILDVGLAQCKFLFSSSDPQVWAANKQSPQCAFIVKIFKPVSERNHGGSREVGRFELTQSNGASELKHDTVIQCHTQYHRRYTHFWRKSFCFLDSSHFGACASIIFNISLPYSAHTAFLWGILGVKPMRSLLAAAVAWEKSCMPNSFVPALRTNWCRKSKHSEAPAGCNPMPKSPRRGPSGVKTIIYIIEFHIISCKISTWRSWSRSCFLSKSIHENRLSPALSH